MLNDLKIKKFVKNFFLERVFQNQKLKAEIKEGFAFNPSYGIFFLQDLGSLGVAKVL